MPSEGNSRYNDLQAITFPGWGYHHGFGGIPKGREAELVAAEWSSWMVQNASEAFKGWLPRKEKSFQRFEKFGEGAYRHVYRALDLEQRNNYSNIIKLEGGAVEHLR